MTVPNNGFNTASKSFCTTAYCYINDDTGSIKDLENMYNDLQGFSEFSDPYSGKFNYRWTTSIWTALAHCYVKEGNAVSALNIFNKIHSYGDIKLWPTTILNALGACYVTGQSEDYSIKIYESALREFEILSLVSRVSVIIDASNILGLIMGNTDMKISSLYVKANDLLKPLQ